MKKLAGGHNNFLLIFIIFLFFYSQSLFASQIYDYQTDEFIKLLNSKTLSVNKYNKEIKFKTPLLKFNPPCNPSRSINYELKNKYIKKIIKYKRPILRIK